MGIRVSVIAATFDRGPLLSRALECYARQTLRWDNWEYVLVDDGSRDDTLAVCERWLRRGLPLRVFSAAELGRPKEPGVWRDGCALRNAASTYAVGTVLVPTHPEVMPPPEALALAVAAVEAEPGAWHTAVPFWLPAGDVDAVDWRADLKNLHGMPEFWASDWETCPHRAGVMMDFRNQHQQCRDGATEDRGWESEIWFAIDTNLWRRLGGFREFMRWGSVDVDFLSRRRGAGIPTRILKSPDSPAPSESLMVYHQDHPSPRSHDAVIRELTELGAVYTDFESAARAGGLYENYWGGPRERAADGDLAGVLVDHVARYAWAAGYVRGGGRVLDAPCGTGYGARVLERAAPAHDYVGVDIDGESVRWAGQHYAGPGRRFVQADLCDLPPTLGSFDLALCFEGIEHVRRQPAALASLFEALTPGGRLLVSTPQKGATPGTPWDRYMLGRDEFAALVAAAGFRDLTWFHQIGYGGGPGGDPHRAAPGGVPAGNRPVAGEPPADAAVMVLEAVK